ncbi:MAG: glycosyltransferase family 2 protein [Thermoleophilaceae bacterium]|nr:glycosyltransferase family 2 protein [Thermoleophilaceae bacterium]
MSSDANSEPLTTVAMAAYRPRAELLREAVRSVLAQTEPRLELVVVDDASPEPVAPLLADIRDPRLRVVRRRRNGGAGAARNVALRLARSPLFSQLDADDLWEPEYLESILPCFDDPAVGLAYANVEILGHPTGHSTYIWDPSVHPMYRFPKIAEQNPVPSPTATVRTAAARAVGGYASWLRLAQDYHLWLKLAAAGWRFAYVDRKLARYRWPEPGRGHTFDRARHERYELAMWLAFMLRHPLTPGPRRQVRTRVRRAAAALRRRPDR